MRSVFQNLNDGQRSCILLIDEVFMRPMLLYHDGQLFCNSVSDNTQFSKAVLAFMIFCLYGLYSVYKFLAKNVTYQHIRY